MAFTIPNVGDASHVDQAEPDAVDFAILLDGIEGDGVISGCAVTAQATPDMTVAVASGTVRLGGANSSVTAGNLTIGAASATNPRFDLIAVNSSGTKSVVAGSAAGNPVFPQVPASSIILAAVYVPANDTAVNSTQITDKRVFVFTSSVLDHGALIGLTDDDHTQYVLDTDIQALDFLVGTATGYLSGEIVAGTAPGGELGGTWGTPTVDTIHSGSSHAGVVSTHEAAGDPHTGYRLESADHTHESTGAEAGQIDHGAASTAASLLDDDHPQYMYANMLMNSGMNFFQRQVPGTATARSDDTYGPDRWNILTQTASVNCEQSTGDRAVNAVLLTQNQVAAQRFGIEQIIPNRDSKEHRSSSFRFKFRAKGSTTLTLRFAILEWTGTVDVVTSDVVNDWTSVTYTAGNFFLAANLTVTAVGSQSITTSWTTCSLTGTLGASTNNIIVFAWTEGTAAQNVTVEISECIGIAGSMEPEWMATPQSYDLVLCQHFYEKSYELAVAPGTSTLNGWTVIFANATAGTEIGNIPTKYKVTKRIGSTPSYWDAVGNASRISEIASCGGRTDNITPSIGVLRSVEGGFEMGHDPAGNILGFGYQWSVDSEL